MLKSSVLDVSQPVWNLMMKNIYNVGAIQLQKDDFVLNILYSDPSPTNFIKPEDIGETIYWVATRPKNINVNRIEIMAGLQAFNPFNVIKND